MNRPLLLALLLPACSTASPLPNLKSTEIVLVQPTVIELQPNRLPVVFAQFQGEATQGDVEARMLVDSGADITVLSKSFAEEIGLYVAHFDGESSMWGSGGGSVPLTHYAAIDQLQIGELIANDFHLPLIESGTFASGEIDGILGQDLIGRFATVFDVEGGSVHFLPSNLDQEQVTEYLAECEFEGTWALEEIEYRPSPYLVITCSALGEGETLEIEVDTGATGTSMPKALCIALNLVPTGEGNHIGIDGPFQTTNYSIKGLELFGYHINFEVSESQLEYGLMGMDVFKQFVLVLDGPNNLMWLHHRSLEPE